MAVDVIPQLRKEVLDLRRLLENLVRFGTVKSVDTDARTVVVEWPNGVSSKAIPWALSSASFDAEPVVGDQALVLAPGGDPASSTALVGISSVDSSRGDKVPASRSDLTKTELDEIKEVLDDLKLAHNTHQHSAPNGASAPTVTSTKTYVADSVEATYVKVD